MAKITVHAGDFKKGVGPTPVVTQTVTSGVGVYTLTVSLPASSGGAAGVTISDTLPTGFTYASTSAINLTGGSVQTSVANPPVGSATPSWGVFTILAGGSVSITFNVNIANTVPSGTYQNPAAATFLDPERVIANATQSANYNPASSVGEDIRVVALRLCRE